jgi:dipeptidyl aminopeptidase/acylaminoacyl peptidase
MISRLLRSFLFVISIPTGSIATAQSQDAASATPDLLPSEIFAAPRNLVGPKLSPDGQNMVYREQIGNNKFIAIENIATKAVKRILEPEKADLSWYRWAGDNRLLIAVAKNVLFEGDEVRVSGLFAYDITKNEFNIVGKKNTAFNGDEVLFVDPDGAYIVQSVQATIYDYPAVFKINLADNSRQELVKPQLEIFDWIVDDAGVVRMGIAYQDDGSNIYYRNTEQGKFKLISKLRDKAGKEAIENSLLDISHIVSGSDEGYVLSNKETGRFGLYKFNYLTREIGEKIFDHAENDVTGFSLDKSGKQLRAATFTDSRDRIKWFDADMDKQQARLEKALAGQEIWMHPPTRDGKKMIVYTTSATDPGSYYLYEPASKKLTRFSGINDDIVPSKMAETKYLKYTARDGKIIPAYLTLPRGKSPKNLPLIILPHGGPYGVRDTLDFNSEVQFLASRGYAVLQPNYRGSDSYGEAFYKAGEGQIGRMMQDDLDDGMDWLVNEGIADAKRVCVVGGSYGGYAALWGVIRNPERYRCAASFAGVTDFKRQLRYSRKFLNSRHSRKWKQIVRGDKEFDLDLVSPAPQAARLTRPVLLAHGDNDSNVPFSQFKAMVAAAKAANVAIETKVYEDEGHGFSKRENEQDWYDRLGTFLTKHNPAD